jgi:hypothetical protein
VEPLSQSQSKALFYFFVAKSLRNFLAIRISQLFAAVLYYDSPITKDGAGFRHLPSLFHS